MARLLHAEMRSSIRRTNAATPSSPPFAKPGQSWGNIGLIGIAQRSQADNALSRRAALSQLQHLRRRHAENILQDSLRISAQVRGWSALAAKRCLPGQSG